jgi:hypothetical protein
MVLSFNFIAIMRDIAAVSLERLSLLGDYRYNSSTGENHTLAFDQWRSVREIAGHLFRPTARCDVGRHLRRLGGVSLKFVLAISEFSMPHCFRALAVALLLTGPFALETRAASLDGVAVDVKNESEAVMCA